MKKINMVVLLLIAVTMSGCENSTKTSTNSESSSKVESSSSKSDALSISEESEVPLQSSEIEKNSSSNDSDVEEISSDVFPEKIKELDKAVILVGDPTDGKYIETLDALVLACDEMSVDLYETNLTDEDGKTLKNKYKFADSYDILVIIDGKMQKIEIGGGDSLNADILQKVFTIYGL
jgi:hypothetical protein